MNNNRSQQIIAVFRIIRLLKRVDLLSKTPHGFEVQYFFMRQDKREEQNRFVDAWLLKLLRKIGMSKLADKIVERYYQIIYQDIGDTIE